MTEQTRFPAVLNDQFLQKSENGSSPLETFDVEPTLKTMTL